MLPHQNIYKYTWTAPDGKTHVQVYSIYDIPGEMTVILITTWWLQKLGKGW